MAGSSGLGEDLGTMKDIGTKSLIIGALLTSTIFLGVAATSPTDKWDDKQEWGCFHHMPYARSQGMKAILFTLALAFSSNLAKMWEQN